MNKNLEISNFEFIKPINLENITSNFAIIIPYKSRDTLAVYADRSEAMKLYAAYVSGLISEFNNPPNHLLSIFNFLYKDVKSFELSPINTIFSDKKFYDMNDETNVQHEKLSSIVFIWKGYCTEYEKEKISYQFNQFSDEIYSSIRELFILNKQISTMINTEHHDKLNTIYSKEEQLKLRLEECVSIISYQTQYFSLKNRQKSIRRVKSMLIITISYLLILTLATIYAILFTKFR